MRDTKRKFGLGGVEAFFVISSFFLTRKFLENDNIRIKEQFFHRIKRLYPPYILILIIGVAWSLIHYMIPYDIVSHVLMIQNFQWMVTKYSSAMQSMTAHTWTLSIEVWLGLLWLFLLKYFSRKHLKIGICFVGLVSIMYRTIAIIYNLDVYVISLCPLAHMDAFAVGSLLAIRIKELDNESSIKLKRESIVLSIFGGIGIILVIAIISSNNGLTMLEGYRLLSSSPNYLNHVITGNIYLYLAMLSAGIIGMLYISSRNVKEKNGWCYRIFENIGNKSYVLYLIHWPLVVVLKKICSNWQFLFIVVGSASIFIGSLYGVVVERFGQRLKNKQEI